MYLVGKVVFFQGRKSVSVWFPRIGVLRTGGLSSNFAACSFHTSGSRSELRFNAIPNPHKFQNKSRFFGGFFFSNWLIISHLILHTQVLRIKILGPQSIILEKQECYMIIPFLQGKKRWNLGVLPMIGV